MFCHWLRLLQLIHRHQANQICLHTGLTSLWNCESKTEGPKVSGHGKSGQSPRVREYLVPESQQTPALFKNHVWHLSEDRSQNASSSAFQLGMLSNAKAASKSGNSSGTTSWITSCYTSFSLQFTCLALEFGRFSLGCAAGDALMLGCKVVRKWLCSVVWVGRVSGFTGPNQSSKRVRRAKLFQASRIGCPVRSEFWAEEQACQSRPGIPELITVSR